MKKQLIRLVSLTFMVMLLLADVRLEFRQELPGEELEESRLSWREGAPDEGMGLFMFLGLIIRDWLKTLRIMFRKNDEKATVEPIDQKDRSD